MKRKEYEMPSIVVVELKQKPELLAGSEQTGGQNSAEEPGEEEITTEAGG